MSKPKEAVIYVDAGFGFAQLAFAKRLPDAVTQAQAFGVSTLAVGPAYICTSLGYFTKQFARAGVIGVDFTNASPIVAAPGVKTRTIGTNLIAFSVPDGQGGSAMQFDQSTTTLALEKITMAKAAGGPIPKGWAVDKYGHSTTDPEAALQGPPVSMGGYKC